MPRSAFRRALALLGLCSILLGGSLASAPPAAAQVTELEKLDAARDAYNAKDYDKAFYLWLSLCQGGNRGACFNLGLMYANGTGAPQDFVESYKWMHLSAEAGLPEAIAARARLASGMSASEIKLAMDRAEEWKQDNGR